MCTVFRICDAYAPSNSWNFMDSVEVVQRLSWRGWVDCLDIWNSQEFCCFITSLGKQCFPQVEKVLVVMCGLWTLCICDILDLGNYYCALICHLFLSVLIFYTMVWSSKIKRSKQLQLKISVLKKALGQCFVYPNLLFLSWTCLSSNDLHILGVASKQLLVFPRSSVEIQLIHFTECHVLDFSLKHYSQWTKKWRGEKTHIALQGV